MNKKVVSSLPLLLVGVCLWIMFIFEREMANYGIYSLVNYSTHEIMSIIPFICILVTVIWLVVLVVKSRKNKTFKENIIVISLLLVVSFLQIGYVFSQTNQITISTVAYVESIDPTKNEIVINKSGKQIFLECPMTIFELLETDKEYLITYQSKKETSNEGKVNLVQLIGN